MGTSSEAVRLRHWIPGDYPALAELWNLAYPEDAVTPAQLDHRDAAFREPYRFGRTVASAGDEVVGFVSHAQHEAQYDPQGYFVELVVHPSWRGRGIGGELHRTLLGELTPLGAQRLRLQASEADPRSLAIAEHWGYRETKRDFPSTLELADFDPEPFEAARRSVASEGIEIRSLAELGDSPEVRRRFFALFSEVRQDVPRASPATPMTFEYFAANFFESPGFVPEAAFVATEGGRFVGLAQLWSGAVEGEFQAGLTGVLRSHRGRGIALALKLATIAYASGVGAQRIHTDNDTRNAPMLAINEKLGFQRRPALVSMLLELT